VETGALPRNAARSRAAILDAAERLFAERGPGAATLQEIGVAAGLSRAAPSYFFGSKTALHGAVLDRAFAARDDAVRAAVAPLHAWAAGDDARSLEEVLHDAVDGYAAFLLERPAFARLVGWAALDPAAALDHRATDSTAMTEAFAALRAAAPRGGVGPFAVRQAVLVLVSLTFSPLSQRTTLLRALGLDPREPAVRAELVDLAVAQLLALVTRA